MIIAVDFDGTCVTHAFPKVGKDIGAVPVLKALVDCGHHLILYTMRDGTRANEIVPLHEAIEWFNQNGIELYDVNHNPTQFRWSKSPKVYAHLYIDDAALGIPLKFDKQMSERPFVDWEKVEQLLKEKRNNMMETFDFQEALSYIEADMPVCLNIDGKERKYFLKEGEIMCTPNGKKHLTYKVKQFQIDAVMSKEWRLCE